MISIFSAKFMHDVAKEKRSKFLEKRISEAANTGGFEVTLPIYQINREDIKILRELGYECNYDFDSVTISWENVL